MRTPHVGLAIVAVATALTATRADPLDEVKRAAETECTQLTVRLPIEEEHHVGRALAVRDAQAHGGLYLDAVVTAPVRTTLGAGAKNDLNRYVQRVGARISVTTAHVPGPWTFGILNDAAPRVVYEIGGYVFVTTGLLEQLKDEAELAGALSLGVSAVGSSDSLDAYRQARMQACVLARTGYGLIVKGVADTAGAEEPIAASKFGKSIAAFFSPSSENGGGDLRDFSTWYLNEVDAALAAAVLPAEARARHDADALVLLSTGGYDPGALAIAIDLVDPLGSKARVAALDALRAKPDFGMNGGASPPFPKDLAMPRSGANK